MNITRKKIIVFSCVLLLQLGLFASLAHAAAHPFHVQDELCASFINFGQQDIPFDSTIPVIKFQSLSVQVFSESGQRVHTSFHPAYASRAPPSS